MARRRSLGLRARSTVAWAILALMISSGLVVLGYAVTREQLTADRRQTATGSAFLNARVLRSSLRGSDPDVSAALESLVGEREARHLARVDGQWYSGSVGTGPDDLSASLRELVDAGRVGVQQFRVDGEVVVGVAVPIPAVDTQFFELVSMTDIERTLEGLLRALLAGAAVAAVVGAAVGWYVSGRVLRPLREFAGAAESIAEGSFGTRVRANDDPDLLALEAAFNRMAATVQERIDREVRFTSDVSHELRAPVAAMVSAINIARRREGDPEALRRALDEMEERMSTLHRLIDDLLELSRAEAGVAQLQLEPVEPGHLVQALLARMDRGDVPVTCGAGVPPVVHADKRRLGQMLQNLVDNAQRYAGGVTGVAIDAVGDRLRFAVEDDGPGVADHERSYIFERFARGDAAAASGAGGTGLGLALVAEHAALHGGRVLFEDREGGGSRFVIELPLVGAP